LELTDALMLQRHQSPHWPAVPCNYGKYTVIQSGSGGQPGGQPKFWGRRCLHAFARNTTGHGV